MPQWIIRIIFKCNTTSWIPFGVFLSESFSSKTTKFQMLTLSQLAYENIFIKFNFLIKQYFNFFINLIRIYHENRLDKYLRLVSEKWPFWNGLCRNLNIKSPEFVSFTGTTRLSLVLRSAVVTDKLDSVSQRTSSVNSTAQCVQNSSHTQSC